MIKTGRKPATKAGKRQIYGVEVMVKAKPARTVVKAFPAKALKANMNKEPNMFSAAQLVAAARAAPAAKIAHAAPKPPRMC